MICRIAFVLSMFFLLEAAGCDIFQTREPQPPSEGSSGFKPADTPEIVLENMTAAVREHNVEQYIRCLIDTSASSRTFAYTASGDFQGVFGSWGLEDEQRYFQNLGSPVGAVPYLNFSNFQWLNSSSSSTEYIADYLLYYPHSRAEVPKQVKGHMHLFLAVDNQRRWSIYRWDDAGTVPDSTWSYLKFKFQ